MPPEEETDYKLALQVHAELNNIDLPAELASASSSAWKLEAIAHDEDLARALQMEEEGQAGLGGTGADWIPPETFTFHEQLFDEENPEYPEDRGHEGYIEGHSEEWVDDLDDMDALLRQPHQYARKAQDRRERLLAIEGTYIGKVLEASKEDCAVYAQTPLVAPSGDQLTSLGNFAAHIHAAKCSCCGTRHLSSPSKATVIFKTWEEGRGDFLSSQLACTHCKASICIFCGSNNLDKGSLIRVHGKNVSWCCYGGRLFLIWMILCGFDEHLSSAAKAPKVRSKKREKDSSESLVERERKRRPRKHATSRMDNGVGFGGNYHNYGAQFAAPWHQRHNRENNHIAQLKEDTFTVMVFKLLRGLSPAPSRNLNFDMEPPGALSEMMLGSNVFNHCTSLLRNDSWMDVSDRHMVYDQLVDFVTSLCTHHRTAPLVYNERLVRVGGNNLLEVSFEAASSTLYEKAAPIGCSLRNLATQCRLFVERAESHKNDFSNKDDESLLILARRLNDLWVHLEANGAKNSTVPPDGTTLAVDAVSDVPNKQMMDMHTFGERAKDLKDAPRGRMKRLITEITSMSTNLPPGIFVRYGSERPDVLKAIIIGPSGTPYENGIFEFDLFCDKHYPNTPPHVSFKTTGSGTVRFNPNLYETGKVCLSLLGTWSGEPWKPGESTLLQVLLSVQAMILCEEPWFNEPGRETSRGAGSNEQSKAYNKAIRSYTIEHAIIAYANHPPPLWKDVIMEHFANHANEILKTVQEWTRLENEKSKQSRVDEIIYYPESRPSQSIASMHAELQDAMNKFGAKLVLSTEKPAAQGKAKPPRRLKPFQVLSSMWSDGPFPFGAPNYLNPPQPGFTGSKPTAGFPGYMSALYGPSPKGKEKAERLVGAAPHAPQAQPEAPSPFVPYPCVPVAGGFLIGQPGHGGSINHTAGPQTSRGSNSNFTPSGHGGGRGGFAQPPSSTISSTPSPYARSFGDNLGSPSINGGRSQDPSARGRGRAASPYTAGRGHFLGSPYPFPPAMPPAFSAVGRGNMGGSMPGQMLDPGSRGGRGRGRGTGSRWDLGPRGGMGSGLS